MLTCEFATLEATSDPVEIIVRFIQPVKDEHKWLEGPTTEDEPWNETESLKRKITAKVREDLANHHMPENVTIVCRSHEELVKAIEQAKAAHDLARALVKTGKYAPPANQPTAYRGGCF